MIDKDTFFCDNSRCDSHVNHNHDTFRVMKDNGSTIDIKRYKYNTPYTGRNFYLCDVCSHAIGMVI